MVRGAYMNEERTIAANAGSISPVWDTIEETHASYNGCLEQIIPNLCENSKLMVASHNANTVKIAK
jgi:proline dehydrogenase